MRIVVYILGELGTWTDERHLTSHNVQELGEFVDAGKSEKFQEAVGHMVAWRAWFLVGPLDAEQATADQLRQDGSAGAAASLLDFPARAALLVGGDGQHVDTGGTRL